MALKDDILEFVDSNDGYATLQDTVEVFKDAVEGETRTIFMEIASLINEGLIERREHPETGFTHLLVREEEEYDYYE